MTGSIPNLLIVLAGFRMEGSVVSTHRFGSGHINDSYLVRTMPEEAADYVLQRINHHIFLNVGELMNNIRKVTHHLEKKVKTLKIKDYRVLELIPAMEGGFLIRDDDGNFWRLYRYVDGSRSYDIVKNPQLAYEGGKAFGMFQYLVSDMEVSTMYEILPGFHDISLRLAAFRKSVIEDPEGRVAEVAKEIGFIEERAHEMYRISDLGRLGKIPLRVTHNDTKFNNILFNDQNRAICIVDLDTMMPGYILYDFGDAIRTGANTATEDEQDLEKVDINLEMFEAYASGFLGMAKNFLVPEETGHLAFSARFMTFIIGLRFLTDHIAGDHYYKIHFPGHNLQRARTQFKLLSGMEKNQETMQKIIEKLIR